MTLNLKFFRFICITSNSNIKRNLQGTTLESLDWLLKWNTLVELRHDGVKSFLSKHHQIVARILNLRILKTFGEIIYAYVNNNIHFHKNKKSYFVDSGFVKLSDEQYKNISWKLQVHEHNKAPSEIILPHCHFVKSRVRKVAIRKSFIFSAGYWN